MRKLAAGVIFLLCFRAWPETLNVLYMAQAGYSPQDVEQRSRLFSEKTGIDVRLQFEEYEAIYSLIIAPDSAYDVILVDNIWTADFASRGILEPVPPRIRRIIENGTIPAIYNANAYKGRVWSVPFLANFQLLYTNMTLLRQAGYSRPPETLADLRDMAAAAKGKGIMEYPVFDSLRQEEVLVCELVWLSGLDGTEWETESGRFLVDRPELRNAVEYLLRLKREGLLNPFSFESGETFSSEVFIWGDALFTTNWTFVIGEMERAQGLSVRPKPFELRVSLLPVRKSGELSKTINGFQGLSVMRNSLMKDAAWDYIMFLSSADFQRQHLEEFSVWTQVWSEGKTRAVDPYFEVKQNQVRGALRRPVHPLYQEISVIIQKWVYEALMEEISVDEAFRRMQSDIDGLAL